MSRLYGRDPFELPEGAAHPEGWYGLTCWNGLSESQQNRLINEGVLELGYMPEGWCTNPATVAIETMADQKPGPRFYCRTCAATYLLDRREQDGGKADPH